jgi:hypothetical protein
MRSRGLLVCNNHQSLLPQVQDEDDIYTFLALVLEAGARWEPDEGSGIDNEERDMEDPGFCGGRDIDDEGRVVEDEGCCCGGRGIDDEGRIVEDEGRCCGGGIDVEDAGRCCGGRGIDSEGRVIEDEGCCRGGRGFDDRGCDESCCGGGRGIDNPGCDVDDEGFCEACGFDAEGPEVVGIDDGGRVIEVFELGNVDNLWPDVGWLYFQTRDVVSAPKLSFSYIGRVLWHLQSNIHTFSFPFSIA